jgi:hypothetical protein
MPPSKEIKEKAEELVREIPAGNSRFWPYLSRNEVAAGLVARVRDPNLIWQARSNLCGMATFVHALASDDPLGYVLFARGLYRDAQGWLVGKKHNTLFSPSKETRSSKVPSRMNAADWLVLASLRDHMNRFLHYRWDAHIPVVSDIPLIKLFPLLFAERIAAINWPDDIAALLRAVGYRDVLVDADVSRLKGVNTRDTMVDLVAGHYRVMMLVSVGMFEGGASSATAQHWVRLLTFELNQFALPRDGGAQPGVRFTAFDPQMGAVQHWNETTPTRGVRRVPDPTAVGPKAFRGEYIPLSHFMDHYYGYVAGRL